jgi:hypothetical protein
MRLQEFARQFDDVRTGRVGALPAELLRFDLRRATPDEIQQVERELSAVLPPEYREFMLEYGGGEFMSVDLVPIRSDDPREPGLVEVNRREAVADFIVVSPVGTGDWRGFEVRDGVCDSKVAFWYHDTGEAEIEFTDFYEYLSRQGLRYTTLT